MARTILHMLTPLRHMSPFDVNMAVDAGFGTVVAHTEVALADVAGLAQDSIFSRAPGDGLRTGLFIGGKDAPLCLDLRDAYAEASAIAQGLAKGITDGIADRSAG